LTDALEYFVELCLAYEECEMPLTDFAVRFDIVERSSTDLHDNEMTELSGRRQAKNFRYEFRCFPFIARNDNGVIQLDGHRKPTEVGPGFSVDTRQFQIRGRERNFRPPPVI
jgi:hypothetical protein